MKLFLFKKYLILLCYFISINLHSASITIKGPIPIEFVMSNDVDAVQNAIDQGCQPYENYTSGKYKGQNAIEVATYEEKVNVFNFFLKWIDIYKNRHRNTPLQFAIINHDLVLIESLIAHGANINETNLFNCTPLMKAIHYGNFKIVKFLLKKNAKINLQDNNGNNELIYAANSTFSINEQIIKLLLDSGVKYDKKNIEGMSFKSMIFDDPKFIGTTQKRMQIIKLFKEFEKELINKLLQAAENNQLEEIIKILEINHDLINMPNELGETVLLQAILFERFELIKKLFENPLIKQKPNLLIDQDKHGNFGPNNPVEYAIKLGNPWQDPKRQKWRDIAKYLINKRNEQEKYKNEFKF